jgi:hypothetical protein
MPDGLSRAPRQSRIMTGLLAAAAVLLAMPASLLATKTVLAAIQPTVVALSPETGPTTGGTMVTVYGTNFVSGATTVAFGTLAALSLTVVSSTVLTLATPVASAGQMTVTVTMSGGTSVASPPVTTYEFVQPGVFNTYSARICNTGVGSNTQCSGHQIPAGQTSLPIQVTGGGIPQGTSAVVVDLAAVPPAGQSGTLQALPMGLNWWTATNVAFHNGLYTTVLDTVPVGTNGQIQLFNPNNFAMDAVVDVQGYILPSSTGTAGLFNAVPAARICDTRSGTPTTAGPQCGSGRQLLLNSTMSLQVTGNGGIPTSGVSAAILNVIAFNGTAGSSGNLIFYPTVAHSHRRYS